METSHSFSKYATVGFTWMKWGGRNLVQWCKMYSVVKYLVFSICLCSQLFCCYTLVCFSLSIQQSNCQWKGTASYSDVHWFNLGAFTTTDMHWFAFVWIQMSQKFVRGEPILGGSKLNMTEPEQAANCYMFGARCIICHSTQQGLSLSTVTLVWSMSQT